VSDEMGEGAKRGRVQCFYRRVHGPGVFLCLREREMGMKFFAM